MMHIPIDDKNALCPSQVSSLCSSEGHIAKHAEPHWAVILSVMAWRSYYADSTAVIAGTDLGGRLKHTSGR